MLSLDDRISHLSVRSLLKPEVVALGAKTQRLRDDLLYLLDHFSVYSTIFSLHQICNLLMVREVFIGLSACVDSSDKAFCKSLITKLSFSVVRTTRTDIKIILHMLNSGNTRKIALSTITARSSAYL
jgi:hypothetical protein